MTKKEKLAYAKNLLKNNTFSYFELNGLMGKDPNYDPHGISKTIWRSAAKEVGFNHSNLTEYQGRFYL